MPELSPETQQVMVEALDKPTVLGNPLDVEDLQRMKPEGFDRCLEKFFEEPNFDMLGVRLNLPEAITPSAEKLYTQISDAEPCQRQARLRPHPRHRAARASLVRQIE